MSISKSDKMYQKGWEDAHKNQCDLDLYASDPDYRRGYDNGRASREKYRIWKSYKPDR